MRTRTRALGAVAGVLAIAPFGLALGAGAPPTDAAGQSKLDAKIAAEAEGRKPEVSIPFADAGGIRDWRAVGRDALLIEGTHGKWYRVELMGGCFDLPFAERVGFKSNPTGDFDRFSTVIVRGQRCAVKSVTASAPPPKPVKKAAAAKAGDAKAPETK
jgi:hypothetical protein